MSYRVQRVRQLTAWACASLLQHAVDAEKTKIIENVQTHQISDELFNHPIFGKKHRETGRCQLRMSGIFKIADKLDIYRVLTTSGKVLYIVGRMGITNNLFFKDYKASTDFRVLAICEAHEWYLHHWQEKPTEAYQYNVQELRSRIIEARALPIVGSIPDPSGITPISTLQGVSALRIIIGRTAIHFPLYATMVTDGETWNKLGLAIEQELLARLNANAGNDE